ncbi:hypothetical protein LguiA_020685 [Lonicera macranthoides]
MGLLSVLSIEAVIQKYQLFFGMQSQIPDSHILYVGNLSPKVDEAAVYVFSTKLYVSLPLLYMYFYLIAIQLNRRRFFRHYGDIVSIQFSRKEYVFCNVSFARKEDAERVYYVGFFFPAIYIYATVIFCFH